MKKIYSSGAISMIPCSRGFIFTSVQTEAADSDKSVVAFKQHTFDDGVTALVTRSVYLLNKFGYNFEFYEKNAHDYFNCKAVSLPNQRMLVAYHDGSAVIYDNDCEKKWSGSLKYKGFGPADVICEKDFLWCSYPENNALIKYNLNSMQQTFRVGGSASGGLVEPYGLWLGEDKLVITSSAGGEIVSLNLDNFCVEKFWDMDEPVYQYIKVDSNEVVMTESGIYRL